MKKLVAFILCMALVITCVACFAACNDTAKTYEIAVVTDVGQLMDGGFNQGTYEGAKAYAEANKLTYKYYQPETDRKQPTTIVSQQCVKRSRTAQKLSSLPVSCRQLQ